MAEFVMVIGLLMLVFLGVLQVALLLHAQDVMTADAAEGARAEAAAGASDGSGAARAHDLIARTLSGDVSKAVVCTSRRGAAGPSHLPTVVVTCAGRVALSYIPGHLALSVTGHALIEGR